MHSSYSLTIYQGNEKGCSPSLELKLNPVLNVTLLVDVTIESVSSLCEQDEHTKGQYTTMNRFVKGMLLGLGIGLLVAPMRGEERCVER